MKIYRDKNYTELLFGDVGSDLIRIQSDGSQIQMEGEGGDSYIDTNIKNLIDIRDVLNEIIEKANDES